MTELLASEHELAEFLEATKNQELRTWERERPIGELSRFVFERIEAVGELELM